MKKTEAICFWVALPMLASSLFAQACDEDQLFSFAKTYNVAYQPRGLDSGDLNGDGWEDIVARNWGNQGVSVLINDGSGGFLPAVSYPSSQNGNSVVLGDLNLDGAIDIVAESRFDPWVKVWLNNGDGTFGEPAIFLCSEDPVSMVVEELTGDGILDIALSVRSSTDLILLRGVGDGSFEAYETQELNAGGKLIGHDFNGDGAVDLLSVRSASVTTLINHGDGTFSDQIVYSLVKPGSNLHNAIGDIDQDGDADLVMVERVDGEDFVRVLGNVGFGIFSELQRFSTRGLVDGVVVASISEGFGPDIILSRITFDGEVARGVSVFRNDGGVFENHSYSLPLGSQTGAMIAGDFDQDGDRDLAVAKGLADSVDVLENTGDGRFAGISLAAHGSSLRGSSLFDVDQDGDQDVVTLEREANEVRVFLNHGNGEFGAGESFENGLGNSPQDLAIADLSGFGTIDMVVVNTLSDRFSILVSDGDGNFEPFSSALTANSPVSVDTGDLNGDGFTDIVIRYSSSSSAAMSVYFGTGLWGFAGRIDYPASHGMSSAWLVDIDSDTDLDIVGRFANQIRVLKNDGIGRFDVVETIVSDLGGVSQILPADLDGDGDIDIAIVSDTTNELAVLYQQPGGGFVQSSLYSVGAGMGLVPSLIHGDVNGDGYNDVIAKSGMTLDVLLGLPSGNGFLQATYEHDLLFELGGVFACKDVDGDGFADLMGAMPEQIGMLTTSCIEVPCVADFTGEGVLDFFDVSAFLQAFGSQDPSADLTGEGIFDFFDVSAFLQAFAAGCP
ncbi:MAG: FG-GAP-like repeat-containing protein [Phycisphaerales bacterium]